MFTFKESLPDPWPRPCIQPFRMLITDDEKKIGSADNWKSYKHPRTSLCLTHLEGAGCGTGKRVRMVPILRWDEMGVWEWYFRSLSLFCLTLGSTDADLCVQFWQKMRRYKVRMCLKVAQVMVVVFLLLIEICDLGRSKWVLSNSFLCSSHQSHMMTQTWRQNKDQWSKYFKWILL